MTRLETAVTSISPLFPTSKVIFLQEVGLLVKVVHFHAASEGKNKNT